MPEHERRGLSVFHRSGLFRIMIIKSIGELIKVSAAFYCGVDPVIQALETEGFSMTMRFDRLLVSNPATLFSW